MVSLEKCELIGLQIVHLFHTLSGISKVHQPETHLRKVEVGIWNKDMTPDLKFNVPVCKTDRLKKSFIVSHSLRM